MGSETVGPKGSQGTPRNWTHLVGELAIGGDASLDVQGVCLPDCWCLNEGSFCILRLDGNGRRTVMDAVWIAIGIDQCCITLDD